MADSRTALIFINSLVFMTPTDYWKEGALGAAGVRDGLQLGRSVLSIAVILCLHAHSLFI